MSHQILCKPVKTICKTAVTIYVVVASVIILAAIWPIFPRRK